MEAEPARLGRLLRPLCRALGLPPPAALPPTSAEAAAKKPPETSSTLEDDDYVPFTRNRRPGGEWDFAAIAAEWP